MNFFPPEYYQVANSEAEAIAVERLSSSLRKYDMLSTLSYIGALLAMPSLQAHCSRLEIFAYAALLSCKGKHLPTRQTLEHWLNNQLGSQDITRLEDPAEDVFVANVISQEDECQIIPGIWEGIDSSLSLLFESIEHYGGAPQKEWVQPSKALLALSTALIKRLGLVRWHYELSIPRSYIKLPKGKIFHGLAKNMVFKQDYLNSIGISAEHLDNFCISKKDFFEMKSNGMRGSYFFEKPLIKNTEGDYVIYLPTCMAYAAKRDIFKRSNNDSELRKLNDISFILSSNTTLDAVYRSNNKHDFKIIRTPENDNANDIVKIYIFESGKGHFLCLCFLNVSDTGIYISKDHYESAEYSEAEESRIHEAIKSAIGSICKNFTVSSGHTLILGEHLSNSYALAKLESIKNWSCDIIHYADLIMLLSSQDCSIEKFIVFLMQISDVQLNGITINGAGGLLNLFSFWQINNFCFFDSRIQHGKSINIIIGMDYAVEFRRRIRIEYDTRIMKNIAGIKSTYKRLHAHSIYETERGMPIYVSIEHVKSGILSGFFEHNNAHFWLKATADSQCENTKRMIFDLWSGIITLFYKYISELYRDTEVIKYDIEFFLDFQISDEINEKDLIKQNFDLTTYEHKSHSSYKIVIDDRILALFYGPTNDGERKIFEKIISIILSLNNDIDRDSMHSSVNLFLNRSAKIIHVRYTNDPIDFLMSQHRVKTYSIPNEYIAHKRTNFFRWLPPCGNDYTPSRDESIKVLNTAVSKSINELVNELSMLDAGEVIHSLLRFNETLFHSKKIWRGTAQAVLALHGDADAHTAATDVEISRAKGSVAIRALIEAALCECRAEGGVKPDGYCLDALIAQMILIIEAGGLSDAIHFGLIDKGLTIKPSGTFVVNDSNFAHLSLSFMEEMHGLSFQQAASTYGYLEHADNSNQPKETPESIDDDFSDAFFAEFGISNNDFFSIYTAICEMAFEKGDVIFFFDQEALIEKCSPYNIESHVVINFLDKFSLSPRTSWLPTDGSSPKDIQPWRFGRRLSLTNRPIIKIDHSKHPKYTVGIGLLEESIKHIITSIHEALYDKDMFSSKEMRSYIGSRIDKLGHAFSKTIQSELNKLGFLSKTEVKMTQLGAPKTPNLGDVDVLAISDCGIVLIIECKRLRTARTNAEIAHTCSNFRGNAGDRLAKHLRRVDWLKNNETSIKKIFNLHDDINLKFYAPLVCNLPVPFKYLQNLPIDPADVVPFSKLKDYILSFG